MYNSAAIGNLYQPIGLELLQYAPNEGVKGLLGESLSTEFSSVCYTSLFMETLLTKFALNAVFFSLQNNDRSVDYYMDRNAVSKKAGFHS